MTAQRLIGSARGAVAFGFALAALAYLSDRFPTSILVNAGSAFAAGAAAALALTWGNSVESKSVAGFGCGFVLMWMIVLFGMISIQGGGAPDLGWGAVSAGFGFALGGAIGGFMLRPALAVIGALAFGLGGGIAGYLSFYFIGNGWMNGSLPVAMGIGGAIAGGLFGAIASRADSR